MMKTSVFWLCAALAAGGCGIKEEVYNAKVDELTKTQAELDETKKNADAYKAQAEATQKKLDADLKACEMRLTALGGNLSSVKGQRDQAMKDIEDLKKQREQAEKRAAQFREMVAKFKSMIDAGKLQVEFRDGLMLVKLPDNILFDPGKTELKKEGEDALRQVTDVLKAIPNRNFQVAGHTDNIPIKSRRFRSNWDLSTARAVEVVNFMISSGMEPKRLSAAGYADQSPVATNDSQENKAKNRRIEITLVPNLDDLPPIDEALKESPVAEPAATPPAPNKS
jgi:chemotaxis protein MotB